MQQVANTLAALQDAAAAVKMAYDYEDEDTAINDAAFAVIEMLRTLHNNNFDVVDLAQQALE
jgi:uncharacterized protein YkuJ